MTFACASTLRRSYAPKLSHHSHLCSAGLAPDLKSTSKLGAVASLVLVVQSFGEMRSGASCSLHFLCCTITRLFCGCEGTSTSCIDLGQACRDCHHGCCWSPTDFAKGGAQQRRFHLRGNCAYLQIQGPRSFWLTNFEFKFI